MPFLLVNDCLSSTVASNKQVVNGFFWAGKPVANHNRESTRSTALGVSVAILFLYLFISCYVVIFDYMFTFSITAKLSFQFHGVDFSRLDIISFYLSTAHTLRDWF